MRRQAWRSSSWMASASSSSPARTAAGAARLVALEAAGHAGDGPEEVHRRGPRAAQERADALEVRAQRRAFQDRAADSERDAERGRHADGRRAAHGHVADGRRDRVLVGRAQVDLFERQEALVEHQQAVLLPLQRLNAGELHATPS